MINDAFHAPPLTALPGLAAVIKAGKHPWGLPASFDFAWRPVAKAFPAKSSQHPTISEFAEGESIVDRNGTDGSSVSRPLRRPVGTAAGKNNTGQRQRGAPLCRCRLSAGRFRPAILRYRLRQGRSGGVCGGFPARLSFCRVASTADFPSKTAPGGAYRL